MEGLKTYYIVSDRASTKGLDGPVQKPNRLPTIADQIGRCLATIIPASEPTQIYGSPLRDSRMTANTIAEWMKLDFITDEDGLLRPQFKILAAEKRRILLQQRYFPIQIRAEARNYANFVIVADEPLAFAGALSRGKVTVQDLETEFDPSSILVTKNNQSIEVINTNDLAYPRTPLV
jgi:hypothetical protein